jgi:hypothetical protein
MICFTMQCYVKQYYDLWSDIKHWYVLRWFEFLCNATPNCSCLKNIKHSKDGGDIPQLYDECSWSVSSQWDGHQGMLRKRIHLSIYNEAPTNS